MFIATSPLPLPRAMSFLPHCQSTVVTERSSTRGSMVSRRKVRRGSPAVSSTFLRISDPTLDQPGLSADEALCVCLCLCLLLWRVLWSTRIQSIHPSITTTPPVYPEGTHLIVSGGCGGCCCTSARLLTIRCAPVGSLLPVPFLALRSSRGSSTRSFTMSVQSRATLLPSPEQKVCGRGTEKRQTPEMSAVL